MGNKTTFCEPRQQVINVPDFWVMVNGSRHRFLALDYDGTLAPFHVDPLQAYPLPGIVELLQAIKNQEHTALAIVSGRPVAEILMLLGDLGIACIGSHGFELRQPDGEIILRPPSLQQREGLEMATELARRKGFEAKLEIKIASVALHTRGLPIDEAARMEGEMFAEWSHLGPRHGLECRRFNGGVEIRSTGRHKGDALLELLAEQPAETFSVYVGDDETDEDAFRLLQDRAHGIGIKVGDPAVATAASGFLPDCAAVKTFLEAWLMVIRGGRAEGIPA